MTEFQKMAERSMRIRTILEWGFALLIIVLYTAGVVAATLLYSKR